MRRCNLLLSVVVSFVLLSMVKADSPTLNYQGRLTAGGSDFTGQGYFKFVLLDWQNGVWSNDGSGGTNQPGDPVTVEVNNGLFNTELGSPSEGMTNISPLVFHESFLWLRTWFSTNHLGPFEQLVPDIRIRSMDLAHFNTGNMVVVDDDGSADFMDPQEAVSFVVDNDRYDTILLMPGYYELEDPLSVPDNEWVTILGVHRDHVSLVRSNGVALLPFDGTLENVTVRGDPAVGVQVPTNSYNLDLIRCRLQSYDELSGPVLQLSAADDTSEHSVRAFECSFWSEATETVVEVGGDVRLELEHTRIQGEGGFVLSVEGNAEVEALDCDFQMQQGGDGIFLDEMEGGLQLRGCSVWPEDGDAVHAEGGDGWLEFRNVRFGGPFIVNDSGLNGSFIDCDLDNGFAMSNGGRFEFHRTRISGRDGNDAISLDGTNWAGMAMDACDVNGEGSRALSASDWGGGLEARDTDFRSSDETTLDVELGPTVDRSTRLSLERCRVNNWRNTAGGYDAISCINQSTNDADLELMLSECNVHAGDGMGSGVRAVRSSMEITGGRIESQGGDGIHVTESEVSVSFAEVWGLEYGVWSENAWVELQHAGVGGESAGVHASNTWFMTEFSDLEGEEDSALVLDGGSCIGIGSVFFSGGSSAVLRDDAVFASFQNCLFMAVGTNAAVPVISLAVDDGTNAPVPELAGCMLRGLSATYAVDVGGSAPTGAVRLVTSVLSAGVSPAITLIPAVASLPGGNYVVQTPYTREDLFGGDED